MPPAEPRRWYIFTMSPWPQDHLAVPLSSKPKLKQVGLNVHGARRHERYVMDRTWSLHLYRWAGALQIGGKSFAISPGCVSVEPPNTPLVWRYDTEQCVHYYAHFSLRNVGTTMPLPIMQQAGTAFAPLCDEMESIIKLFTSYPLRAEVRLWDLLLGLAAGQKRDKPSDTALPFAVQTAVAIIENELRASPRVAEIAKRVGISANHLTRLFDQTFGHGVAAHIAKRRLEKAQHLLRKSKLPIKAIATEVGLPDLQQFNKFVRKGTQLSPRQIREKAHKA